MKPLNAVFEEQQKHLAQAGGEASQEECSLIRFLIGGSVFAVDIEKVIEVSEPLQIVRYPEKAEGHEGIVNLRGNIIPVLSFRGAKSSRHLSVCENRLIVLEFAPGRRFCAMVSSPKKVSLEQSAIRESGGIVSIAGMPARIISEGDFPAAVLLEEGGK